MSKSKAAPTLKPVDAVDWTGVRLQRIDYESAAKIFAQGDPATSVMYVDNGAVRLSVLSHAGKEAVVAVLDVGHFFGEGCLAGQSQRMATATAMAPCTILAVEKPEMVRQLHAAPAFADRFLTHMLTQEHPYRRRPRRPAVQLHREAARPYALAAGAVRRARGISPRASEAVSEVLAEMVGTTRSRVNFFMNKFRKLGFIDYNGALKVNNSLLSVVLRD